MKFVLLYETHLFCNYELDIFKNRQQKTRKPGSCVDT